MTYTPPPRLACFTQYDYLAAAAVHLLREREAKYPAAVTAGHMTAKQAAQGLELMRVVVAQWRWVIDPAQPPLPSFDYDRGRFGAANHLLVAELQRVADRAQALALRNAADFAKGEMADLCAALAWYQHGDCGDARVIAPHRRQCRAAKLATAA